MGKRHKSGFAVAWLTMLSHRVTPSPPLSSKMTAETKIRVLTPRTSVPLAWIREMTACTQGQMTDRNKLLYYLWYAVFAYP